MTILTRVALFLSATRPESTGGEDLSLRVIRQYDPARDVFPPTVVVDMRPHGILWKDGHWNVIEGEEFS